MNEDYRKKVYNMDNWQQMHVQQLSYWRNLVIIIASAALPKIACQQDIGQAKCVGTEE
ncbi:MAG: hypothetical protein ACK4E0_15815 [Chitinophagaceae bacterium]